MGNIFTCQKCHSVEELQKKVQDLEAQLEKQEEEYAKQLEKHFEDFQKIIKRKEQRLLEDHSLMANWLADAYQAAGFNADFEEEEEVEEQKPKSMKRRLDDDGTNEKTSESKRFRED